jgi:hypothetical protein
MIRAVAILALVVTATSSQPPAPTPAKTALIQQNHGQSEQTKTSGNEKNTESPTASADQSKAKVAIRNRTQPEEQTQNGPPQQQPVEIWPEATAIAVAVATIVLAGLAIWQSHLMRKGLAETAKAADATTSAAKTASDTLRIGERAYLKASEYDILPVRIEHGAEGNAHFSFEIANIGRTRAKIIECTADGIMAAAALDSFPGPFEGKSAAYTDGIIIWPDDSIVVGFDLFPINVDKDWVDIQSRKVIVSVWGGVRYSDVFGDEHVTKFALVYHSARDRPDSDEFFTPPKSGQFNDAD